MSRRLTRTGLVAGLAAFACAGYASSASATYHQNLIREVGYGSGGQYVELQAYAAGQNLVAGKHITTFGPLPTNPVADPPQSDYVIPSNVGNGADQASILIANSDTVFGVAADFNAGSNLDLFVGEGGMGGTVCFLDSSYPAPIDCVTFAGTVWPGTTAPLFDPPQFGTPIALPGPSLYGQALTRKTTSGSPQLDFADDTNSSSDFTIGPINPRNNATTATENPPVPPDTPTPTTSFNVKAAIKKCKKKFPKGPKRTKCIKKAKSRASAP